MSEIRIPSLDEIARALYELEPRTLTWYELLAKSAEDVDGISERALLHKLRGEAFRLGTRLFIDPLPAPRPPLGVEWAPLPHEQVLETVRLLLPGFEIQVYDDSPWHGTAVKVLRRVEMGGVTFSDYILMADERTGGSVVEFVRRMRQNAIDAYGLTAAFEAEWDRARHDAHDLAVSAVLGLIESTRRWISGDPDGELDEPERGYLEPLSPEMAQLKARIESLR